MIANLEAERSCLGAILLDNACYNETRELSVDHFSLDSHQRIYRSMLELAEGGTPIDLVTLTEELRKHGDVESVGGISYLAGLTDGIPRRSSLDSYIRILTEKMQLRQIIHKATAAIEAAEQCEPAISVMESLRQGIDQIVSGSPESNAELFVPAQTFMAQTKTEIEWRVRKVIEVGTNGFIVALPKSGKSFAVCDLAIALATGENWLGFETSRCRTALVGREDYAGTTARRLQRILIGRQIPQSGFLNDWLWVNTRQQSSNLMLDKPQELMALIKNLKRRKVEFLILDVLNVLHDKDENDNTEMRGVLKHIEQIRNEVGCQVCIVHHSQKNAEEGASLSRIARGSSAIAGFAEYIIGVGLVDEETHTRQMRFESKAAEAHWSFYWKIRDLESSGGVTLERADWIPKEQPRRRSIHTA